MAGNTYTVEPGDSYFGLARKWREDFGIDISPVELLRLNNLTMESAQGRAGWLRVGQQINVPPNIWNAINVPADAAPEPDAAPAPEPDAAPAPEPEPEPDPEPITDDTSDPDPVDEEFMPPPIIPSDPIQDFTTDPDYQAFYAQYLLNIEDIESIRDNEAAALFGAIERNFGQYTGDDPYTMATRSGGQYDILQDRTLEDARNRAAGRGMAFSGGVLRETDDIRTDYGAQKAETWANYMAQKDEADAAQTLAFRDLEAQRLQQERLARERLAAEEAQGIYG